MGEAGAREALREARKGAGMTQAQVAEALGISWRNYQRIEAGRIVGSIPVWDALEDLFGVSQRELRRTGREGSQS